MEAVGVVVDGIEGLKGGPDVVEGDLLGMRDLPEVCTWYFSF